MKKFFKRLFKRKPKKAQSLKDYLGMKFEEELHYPTADYLNGLKDHLKTQIKYDPTPATRSIFHLAIFRVL